MAAQWGYQGLFHPCDKVTCPGKFQKEVCLGSDRPVHLGLRRNVLVAPRAWQVSESGHSMKGTCCGFPFTVDAGVWGRQVPACWETQSQLLSVIWMLFRTQGRRKRGQPHAVPLRNAPPIPLMCHIPITPHGCPSLSQSPVPRPPLYATELLLFLKLQLQLFHLY